VTIHDNVTSIGNYVFENCTALGRVSIGKNVTSIGNGAFASNSITECYCYATTPPSGYIEPKDGATLYVPIRCGTIYNSYWGDYFDNIIEMD